MLNPCKECGSTDITVKLIPFAGMPIGYMDRFKVVCGKCLADTCEYSNRDSAITIWNRVNPLLSPASRNKEKAADIRNRLKLNLEIGNDLNVAFQNEIYNFLCKIAGDDE